MPLAWCFLFVTTTFGIISNSRFFRNSFLQNPNLQVYYCALMCLLWLKNKVHHANSVVFQSIRTTIGTIGNSRAFRILKIESPCFPW